MSRVIWWLSSLKEEIFILIYVNLGVIGVEHLMRREDDLSDVCSGNRVIEGLLFIVPLICNVTVTVSDECCVNWEDVLLSADCLNILLCSGEHNFVAY